METRRPGSWHRARARAFGRAVLLLGLLAGAAGAGPVAGATSAAAQGERAYDAYVPAAAKEGQFYNYSCEFDAAWVVLKTFGHEVPFEEQLAIVGYDTSVAPWYEQTADGYVIHGGDITTAYNGDYTSDLLARTTGEAMIPLFEEFGLDVSAVDERAEIEATLDRGGLIWTKATVDFLPWEPTTWLTPDGAELPTVLGNDHAVVVMGYDEEVVVIRDPLGPTSTNWERQFEYEVPWETFLPVWEAQGNDGLAVFPEGADDGGDTDGGDGDGDAPDVPGGLSGIQIVPVGTDEDE